MALWITKSAPLRPIPRSQAPQFPFSRMRAERLRAWVAAAVLTTACTGSDARSPVEPQVAVLAERRRAVVLRGAAVRSAAELRGARRRCRQRRARPARTVASGSAGNVANAPVILSFSAQPPNLPSGGGTTTLSWKVSNADSLSIDQGVGSVSGESKVVTVSATTIFTLTATNGNGSVSALTAVATGQNPARDGGRYVAMVSPTNGESFLAPSSLRLVAAAHDPNVYTNSPRDGLGGNASKVQFFVDDQVVLEVDGMNAEYWMFKGRTEGVAAGVHRVWARAIYANPASQLDSVPALITVSELGPYDRTVDLTADVVLDRRHRVRAFGNGRQADPAQRQRLPHSLELGCQRRSALAPRRYLPAGKSRQLG